MTSNRTSSNGGGVIGCTLGACLLTGNVAQYGGGAYFSDLVNCTLAGNAATNGGGGAASSCTMSNCIAWYNVAPVDSNFTADVVGIAHSCTTPDPGGEGNVAAPPLFVSASDFHLSLASPCLDRGRTSVRPTAADLDGLPWPLDGDADTVAEVDMGCFESVHPAADSDGDGIPDEWELRYRLSPVDAGDASSDTDTDGTDAATEYGADTDPLDTASVLRLTTVTREGGGVRMSWMGGRQSWQFIEKKNDLLAGTAWQAVFTNTPPTAPWTNCLDLSPLPTQFYRIRARRE